VRTVPVSITSILSGHSRSKTLELPAISKDVCLVLVRRDPTLRTAN
jgi:hypothetical protein